MLKFVIFSLVLSASPASIVQAGQVTVSCDFKGFQGVDDIQVKDHTTSMTVDVFMVGEGFKYYSLPKGESRWSPDIDLSGFNIFNGLVHPRITDDQGRWYFVADGPGTKISQRIKCALAY